MSHLLFLFQLVTLLLVNSMPPPVCQLLYCSTELFKVLYSEIKNVFLILCVFKCIIYVKSILKILKCSTIYPIVLAEYFKLCWTYKQIGLRNALLKQNSFIYAGSLTVILKKILTTKARVAKISEYWTFKYIQLLETCIAFSLFCFEQVRVSSYIMNWH